MRFISIQYWFSILTFNRHKAIIGYLSTINAHEAVATLQNELSLTDALTEKAYVQFAKILEKKWTSNTILQKRVCRNVTSISSS